MKVENLSIKENYDLIEKSNYFDQCKIDND
jgi:hypothetical protein